MPTWRIRVNGVPSVKQHYGWNVPSNSASAAPAMVLTSEQLSGGCERAVGAPRAGALITDGPQWEQHVNNEQQGSKWAAPVIANEQFVVLTGPRTTPAVFRTNSVHPPVTMPNVYASTMIDKSQSGKGKVPRPFVTPTPPPAIIYSLYGGGNTGQ